MSLGGLIPIGGGGGNVKKSTASDLTGGLISIGRPAVQGGANDAGLMDFDVDDLLLDDAGPTKKKSSSSKAKSKSSSSPTSKEKKKKKSSSSSNKKKKKSSSPYDNDWDDTSKDWEKELKENEEAVSPTPKPGIMKRNTNFDEEFAKMLGLDDEFAQQRSSPDAATSPLSGFDRKGTIGEENESEDTLGYMPQFRSKAMEKDDLIDANTIIPTPPNDSINEDRGGGLNASFFLQDDDRASNAHAENDEFDFSLSFLASSSRRAGRSSRRHAIAGSKSDNLFATTTATFSDTFGKPDDSKVNNSKSTFDSLFGSSQKVVTSAPALDPFMSSSKWLSEEPKENQQSSLALNQPEKQISGGSRDRRSVKLQEISSTADDLLAELLPSESIDRKPIVTPAEQLPDLSKAKDDLLADLIPTERKKAPSPSAPPLDFTKAKDDLLADLLPTKPRLSPEPTKTADRPGRRRQQQHDQDEQKQQDDLLAELFPTTKNVLSSSRTHPEEQESTILLSRSEKETPVVSKDAVVTIEKRSDIKDTNEAISVEVPPVAQRSTIKAVQSTGLGDISSARDSLLIDLLHPSPTKPTLELKGRGNSRTKSPSASPIKGSANEQSPQRQNSASTTSRSPVRREEVSPSCSTIESPGKSSAATSDPTVSPGRTRTLTAPMVSSIKEEDFEQSKDSLLEELLTVSPKKSPTSSVTSSPRRYSYSQSFEDERTDVAISPLIHRQSRAPEQITQRITKQDIEATTTGSIDRLPSKEQPTVSSAQEASISSLTSLSETKKTDIRDEDVLHLITWKQREEALREEAATAQEALAVKYEGIVSNLKQELEASKKQLEEEITKSVALSAEMTVQTTKLQSLHAENQVFLVQIQSLQVDKQHLAQELSTIQTQHALCGTQITVFQTEKASFQSQLKSLDEQNRQLLAQLSQEKQCHQDTQLKFAQFQQERDQEAQLLRQKEAHQMERLCQQLQTSLVSLKVLQEQVVEEELTKNHVENETRMRMISNLELTSRSYARQTEEECGKLTSLLGSLEMTLRHYRQEHLEEKERLRQEQLRLSVLASHFQAQSSVLHEQADSNTQVLAKYFTQSLQDVRMAEARLMTRRQQLEDDVKDLHEERAKFAAYREECLAFHARETSRLQQEQTRIDLKWRELRNEREDLDDVIASHEEEFQWLQQEKCLLENEREQIAAKAYEVAELAQKFEVFTQQMVEYEEEFARERQAMTAKIVEFTNQEQTMASEKRKLEERELRLHSQLKQIEKSRRRLNEERKQHMLAALTTKCQPNLLRATDLPEPANTSLYNTIPHSSGQQVQRSRNKRLDQQQKYQPVDNNAKERWDSLLDNRSTGKSVNNQSNVINQSRLAPTESVKAPINPSTPIPSSSPSWTDPSGLSETFRQLVEENWKNHEWSLDVADAALHKERMWINCLGLDTSTPAPILSPASTLQSSPPKITTTTARSTTTTKPSKEPSITSSKPFNQQTKRYHPTGHLRPPPAPKRMLPTAINPAVSVHL